MAFSRPSSSGWLTSRPLLRQVGHELRDPLGVGRGRVARSIAFLKRAVAISSIVRVILRMLRIDLRRLSRARALAMSNQWSSQWSSGMQDAVERFELATCSLTLMRPLAFFAFAWRTVAWNSLIAGVDACIVVVVQVLGLGDLVADLRLLVAHEREERLFPLRRLPSRGTLSRWPRVPA